MKSLALLLLFAVALATSALGCGSEGHETPEVTEPELRVPELPPVPELDSADDPITPEKLTLGSYLYFDRRLSGSGKTNCAACHAPTTAFQDNLSLSTPDRSYPGDTPLLTRNTLSFVNLVYAPVFRWDGSHTDVVDVVAFPFAEPNMNTAQLPADNPANDVPAAQLALHRKLTVELPGYRGAYEDAFDVDIRELDPKELWRLTGRALRAFLTQAVSRDSAFDCWNAGDDSALDEAALRGLAVFRGPGRCIACHSGPFFTDFGFHNLSTAWRDDGTRSDEGRFLVSGDDADRGKFLTPTLRQTYDTSPYFHDGGGPGLRQVLDHLASPAVSADPNRDPIFATPITLGERDKTDLIAFMKSLRGQLPVITPPEAFP